MRRRKGLGERGRYVYKFVVGDEERWKDLSWLTCLILFAISCNVSRWVAGELFARTAVAGRGERKTWEKEISKCTSFLVAMERDGEKLSG